jgi:uroporphyrinogen-III decarboxylase
MVSEGSRVRPDNWEQFTSTQKQEWRYSKWQESTEHLKFINLDAEKRFKAEVKRLVDVYHVREPDQVPVFINARLVPLYANGLDYHTAIYEPEKAVQAGAKFNTKYSADLESFTNVPLIPARVFDVLDYKLYAYPGHGLAKSAYGFQFMEGEYMKADEYNALINDPSDFWLRIYLPRVFGSLEPFRFLNSLTDLIEIPTTQLMPLARPEVQEALRKLIEAGRELSDYSKTINESVRQAQIYGYGAAPPTGGFAKAPFDTIGDTLRGTLGIMKDIYRQPDKLLEALDVIADLTIKNILTSNYTESGLVVHFPLHKGADGWMSQDQFDTFYWASLKKVITAFINEGMIVSLFAEGSYNTRLERINEFPKGTIRWHFDQTDMGKAKNILGKDCCIEGNVPSSLLVIGSPKEVKEYCRKLIEVCAPGGGFILNAGAMPEFPKLENLKAMVEAAREFGIYR